MLRLQQLPSFDSVAAGKKAVVDLPLGRRYHVVWLELGNNAVAANTISDLVDNIVVKINGKPQRTHTGDELNQINGLNGLHYLHGASGTDGQADRRLYLPIYFSEPWRKTQSEVTALALRADGINSFQIEVNVKAGLASPIVQGWYEYDYDPDKRPMGVLSKWFQQDFSAVGTSKDLGGFDKRDFIEAIHFFATSDDKYVTRVKLTANGEEIRDSITYLQNRASLFGREIYRDTLSAADGTRFDLMFDFDDPVNGALPTQINGKPLTEFTVNVTWNAPANGTMRALIKRTGPPE